LKCQTETDPDANGQLLDTASPEPTFEGHPRVADGADKAESSESFRQKLKDWTMRVEYINPFIRSLKNAFHTMLGCEVERGEISLKRETAPSFHISGVVGLSGRAVGTVVLSLSEEVAVKAASTMLMTDMTEVDADVIDAIGELTNMVAGAAKAELEAYELMVSLPNVITGRDHEIRFPSNVTPICVPFHTQWGDLVLEVGFAPVHEPVAVPAH
jgi:chemotaxis protein CheX